MATMIPSPMPRALQEPRLGGERKVYEALAAGTSDRLVAWHGRSFIIQPGKGKARDGESDFVLAHPEHGVIVVEVKGGEIVHDAAGGLWRSRDGRGQEHEIKNPFLQAKNGEYALLRRFLEHPRWRGRSRPLFGRAVIFPDCSGAGFREGLDMDRRIVAFAGDLADMRGFVHRVYTYWANGADAATAAIGAEGMAILDDLLTPSFEIRSPLSLALAEDEAAILRLTEEQSRALDLLAMMPRVGVQGGAGTGKTMLAVEKARRLADAGARVLFTCFNAPLAAFVRERLQALKAPVVVGHFHDLCRRFAEEAGLVLPPEPEQPAAKKQYYDETLPDLLLAALDAMPERRFDAALVDEGQDLRQGWLEAVELCLADPGGGTFYAFYDNNQQLYGRQAELLTRLAQAPLTRNLRNTASIHELAHRFYKGGRVDPGGPPGRPVELVPVTDVPTGLEALRACLERLVAHEEVLPEHIAVLTTRRELAQRPRIGDIPTTDAWEPQPGHVLLTTVHRFKGLERRVVVLFDPVEHSAQNTDVLYYVGCSRALAHLCVIAKPEALVRCQAMAVAH